MLISSNVLISFLVDSNAGHDLLSGSCPSKRIRSRKGELLLIGGLPRVWLDAFYLFHCLLDWLVVTCSSSNNSHVLEATGRYPTLCAKLCTAKTDG